MKANTLFRALGAQAALLRHPEMPEAALWDEAEKATAIISRFALHHPADANNADVVVRVHLPEIEKLLSSIEARIARGY